MSIQYAEEWLRTVVGGQAIHRDDEGDESTSSGALSGGLTPATLKLTPQLQNELTQELQNAPAGPELAPRISAPSLGIGGSSMGGAPKGPNLNNRQPKPPTTKRTGRD